MSKITSFLRHLHDFCYLAEIVFSVIRFHPKEIHLRQTKQYTFAKTILKR